ncbi:Proteophosphoglycan 5 [Rhodotorula diobovata]|uniref:Proteophosphoglycan 5 n=1 Tax=Rhodotorula diobovata TaxID=5288 RepID=A0A5C5FNL1_9BASI|nr:Proteophosphoglycan 5 [Rhodotorula diobovata]
MRRIFGASSITGSSTSNSLASDALPSPSSTTASHEYPSSHGQDAPSANDLSSKSWFGLARSASHSSVASRGSASSPGPGAQPPPHLAAGSSRLAESFNLEVEDDFDFGQLPFGQARSPPPPLSPPGTGRKRDSARSSVGGGFGAGRSRPFSPEATVPAETVSQDALMIELLSGAAVVEARDFEILAWEETQEAKKEHALLSTRIASLTRSVALETRLRDSAAKLVRLSAPASEASTPSNPGSPARPRVTREQAEAQLATAQAKLEALQADLYKVGSREAELRTKLLRHTAAVLAASLRQKEQEDEGLSTPAAAHTLSPALGSPAAASHLRATPSSTGSNRFDGAHFFAGNREAIVPRARTISANGTVGSPYASPQLGASGSFGVNAVQLEHEVAERDARIKELEAQASSLERRLVEVQQQAEADVRAVREALDRKEPEAREEQERTRRELSSAQADVKGLREELHAARDDVEHARRQHEVLRREADEARREAEEHRSRLSLSRSSPSADDAQGEVDAASKLRDQALELAETQHKLEEAEERVVELEEELQRTEEEMKDERRSWEDKVREAEAAGSAASAPLASRVGEVDDDERVEESRRRIEQLEGERQSVVQAISDVLRRHRTRPTLGAALREAPSLDDDLEGRQDLPAYLASTLDAHFDRASSHVEGLGSDLSALHEQRDLRAGIEDEVAQAHERVQALEADVESLQAERDSLETELDLLRSQTHDHEARLSMVPQLEADLKTARDAATQAQRELAGAQSRLAELDALVATQDKQLQDLWRTIPPLEGRTRANSELNDLSSLRTAFEASSPQQPARKPIGALLKNAIGAGGSSSEAGDAVSASGDYSVEALVARVELLLAEDQKLVQKLVALEGEQGAKGDAQDKKIAELEERLEVSGNQEVTMLERLNDLTESLEQTRAEKRKLEADQAQLHEQLAVAQRSPTPAPAAPTDESEMQELRDQIADLEEELADAQRREQKTRAQLLDELSGVQSELTQTRTKLRQAERKLGSK